MSVPTPADLDRLQPLLDRLDSTPEDITDSSGDPWRVWEGPLGGTDPLTIVPGDSTIGPGSPDDDVLVVPEPNVGVRVEMTLDTLGGAPTGGVRITISTPGLIWRPPGLVPARLDERGQLRPDTSRRHVEFHLPRVRIRIERPVDGEFSTRLLGASTDPADPGPERLYEFIRMEPGYALSGPDATFGFAFRGAVLDMSETDTPNSGGDDRLSLPDDWQGVWLPEARIFVSPSGLQGIAVSAGVRDLYVGIGEHKGLSGKFQIEVVNRGAAPALSLRILTPSGELIPIDGPATTVEAPANSTIIADANGGLAPHEYQIAVGGGAPVTADRAPLGPLSTPVTVTVNVTDAGSHTTDRTLTVSLRTATPAGTGASPPSTNPATIERPTDSDVIIEIARQTSNTVTVYAPAATGGLTWTVDGAPLTPDPSGELAIPVAAGSTVSVAVEQELSAEVVEEHCYFTFDEPEERDTYDSARLRVFHTTESHTSQTPQIGQNGALREPWFRAGARERFERYPGASWTIDGFASYEGRANRAEHNERLSQRRIDVLQAILADLGIAGVTPGTAHGHTRAESATADEPEPGSGEWRRATARAEVTATLSGTATLHRPASTPVPTPDADPQPQDPGRPDCFRKIGVRVRIEEDIFTRLEIYGEFDLETAAESQLPSGSSNLPGNPSDGIVNFLVGLKLAADRSSWEVRAEFRGTDADLDGLIRWSDTEGDDTALNIVGGLAIMVPLMAAATPPNPDDGSDLVPMALIGATSGVLSAADVLKTHSLILRGVEVVVADTPISADDTSGPTRTTVTLLFDVETEFSFDAGIVSIDPSKPVTARYKAIGVRAGWDEVDDSTGGIDYVPVPVFDSSRGYTLDIPAGSVSAEPPLDELLRILGVQVSRSNPAFIEIEVGMGVDLGIITVDSARVRVMLETPPSIELTKLGASIEIPGTLHGKGWVSLSEDGFSGALDITLTSINLRASATMTVRRNPAVGFTGVLVGAEVEFPVPLVLGSSGLGIFGFSGGVAINHTRNSGTEPTAALEWVQSQLGSDRGSIMHPAGWNLAADTFAVAAGMLVGTLDGGFLLHLKGMLLVELPGPRLLLIMNADVIKAPPALNSEQSATFLAVLDLDFERGTITIGIVAEYEIEDILEVRVPVTAFFPTRGDSSQWFIDLGSFDDPIRVSILDVFKGTGYLMIHGAGLTHPTLDVTTTSLTIATGFHLRAVLMGSKSIGLYLEAAAGFDALLTFEPLFLAGRIYVSGELRLFIVSIGASAELMVRVGQESLDDPAQTTYVFGEVCGKVDFFFFSVKGCVSLEIGSDPSLPPAPDLLAGVSLVARGPAIVEGDGAGQPIDGKLAVAVEDPGAVSGDDRTLVPIDAIPVVELTATPELEPSATVLGNAPNGPSSAGFTGGWVRRGDLWVRYQVTDISLLEDSVAFDPDGQQTPSTWWVQSPPDPSRPDHLALLSWIPHPTPHALPYGETMLEEVRREWDVCTPPPPPVESLWTFHEQPVGPDPDGWRLPGLAWPDPPGTLDVDRTRVDVHVSEPWRTGNAIADLLGPTPGRIIRDHVACTSTDPVAPGLDSWDDGNLPSRAVGVHSAAGREAVSEALANGTTLLDAVADVTASGWDPQMNPKVGGCEGRILEGPLGSDDAPPSIGPEDDLRLVAEAWEASGHEPNALGNAVRVTPTSPLARASLLLLVPRRALETGALHIRRLTAGGDEIDSTAVTDAHRVGFGASLPSEWWDPGSGPWSDPVQRAGRVAARIAQSHSLQDRNEYELIFVELPDAADTHHVDLGWDRDAPQAELPFYVIALSGLPRSERERHQRQTEYLAGRRSVAETTLTQDPSDHVLLRPGKQYTVKVSWRSQVVQQEARPTDTDSLAWSSTRHSERTFWTVPAEAHPDDLSSWLLATAPTNGENGVLCTQPLRLALTTQSVLRLFAAHNRSLRVRVRAASGAHPPPPAGEADDLFTITLGPDGVRPLHPQIDVVSGFHKALREVAEDLPCLDPGPLPEREEIFIPYEFDPLTEYIVDVFAPAETATEVTDDDRVYRIQFTTSRFHGIEELARLVRFGPIEHVAVSDVSRLETLPERPAGPDLDDAFVHAGLDLPSVPRFPKTQILWGTRGGAMEPIAVVIESSEALWRSRELPSEMPPDPDSEDPSHTWWVREPQEWLLVETGGDAGVDRVVRGPGDTRAVVLLQPGQRGRTLEVDLVLAHNELWRSPEDPADGEEQRASMGVRQLLRPDWEVDD